MAQLMLVPEVAAGATDVILSEWLVEPGATLTAGEPIAVIETEKAVVEIEAEGGATLLRALVTAGNQVAVGAPLALLGEAAELDTDLDAILASLGAADAHDAPAPERRDVPDATQAAEAPPTDSAQRQPARRFVSPIARCLLKEAGIDVEQVTGSGPNGRIVRRDVEAAVAARRSTAETEPVRETTRVEPTQGWTEIPHSRLRRAVAQRLTQSKQQVPHFYLKRAAAIDALLSLREQVNAVSPVRVSVNDFVIRAVACAHQQVPAMNVIWTEDAMRQFSSADVCVAINSDRGLVTPVLRDVSSSSLSGISASVKDYVEQANAGRLQQKDLEGGSITVTNLGMFGVDEFSAIINPPQSAILAVGAARKAVRMLDDAVAPVTELALVLSVDHRAIDGALAAQWLAALVDVLENPLRLLV